jgi:hypothetical protein
MNQVKPDQHFRDTQLTHFGGAAPELVVRRVFVGTDGNQYAELCSATDSTDRRTLSTAILRDKRRFVEVTRSNSE